MAALKGISPNLNAFLDTIGWSEGTSTSPWTKNNGYDIIVAGLNSPHRFTSYAWHPHVLVKVNNEGLTSTAAGRYQLLYRYFMSYATQLKLTDFTPESQDKIAIQQIRERGALADIEAGHIAQAVAKCANIWASFPGSPYGQHTRNLADWLHTYQTKGGKIA